MGPKRCDVGSPTHSMSLHTTPDRAPEVVNAMANVIDRASGLWRGIVNKPLLSTKNHRSPMNSHKALCRTTLTTSLTRLRVRRPRSQPRFYPPQTSYWPLSVPAKTPLVAQSLITTPIAQKRRISFGYH